MARGSPVPLPPAHTPNGRDYGVYRPKQTIWHWGVDLLSDPTTPVVAPERMAVAYRWTDNATAPFVGYGPGGVVALGESGLYHLLGHLDPSSIPEVGAVIQQGVAFAHTAPTGSDGIGQASPHVHWEVRVKPVDSPKTRPYNTIDPVKWVAGANTVSAPPGNSVPSLIPWWILLALGYYIYKTRIE